MHSFSCISRSVATLLLAGLFLTAAGCSTPPGNASDGQRWYIMHHCFACHGENGNDGKAPTIAPLGMRYRKFLATVRNANSPIMPNYSAEKLPNDDVADIYAWLTGK